MKTCRKNFKKKPKAIKIQEAVRLLKSANSVLILTHKCPDLDATGSSVALAKALEQLGKTVSVHAEGNKNAQVRTLLSHTNYKFAKKPKFNVDLIVVLDTNSPMLFDMESVNASKAKKLLIDHHSPKDDIQSFFDVSIVAEDAVSVTQIMYHLLLELKTKFTSEISLAISAGIVSDSANFIAATPDAFEVLACTLKKGKVSFQSVLDAINVPRDVSEKVARLKGAQRMQIHREGGVIIAVTQVSSFEGSVASSLLRMGADVSFVGASKVGEVRISARAKNSLTDAGLHLGRDLLPQVAEMVGGDAGGHAAAAGVTGVMDQNLDAALNKCVTLARDFAKNMQ